MTLLFVSLHVINHVRAFTDIAYGRGDIFIIHIYTGYVIPSHVPIIAIVFIVGNISDLSSWLAVELWDVFCSTIVSGFPSLKIPRCRIIFS